MSLAYIFTIFHKHKYVYIYTYMVPYMLSHMMQVGGMFLHYMKCCNIMNSTYNINICMPPTYIYTVVQRSLSQVPLINLWCEGFLLLTDAFYVSFSIFTSRSRSQAFKARGGCYKSPLFKYIKLIGIPSFKIYSTNRSFLFLRFIN